MPCQKKQVPINAHILKNYFGTLLRVHPTHITFHHPDQHHNHIADPNIMFDMCVATSRALSLPLSSAITARAASPPALTPLEVTTSFPGRDLSSTHLATRQREWEKERETQISPMPSVQEREEERGQPNAKRERERERKPVLTWLG